MKTVGIWVPFVHHIICIAPATDNRIEQDTMIPGEIYFVYTQSHEYNIDIILFKLVIFLGRTT